MGVAMRNISLIAMMLSGVLVLPGAAHAGFWDEVKSVGKQVIDNTVEQTTNAVTNKTADKVNETVGYDKDMVFGIQTELNRLGFGGGQPDGIYGRGTANAIKAFQRAVGLAIDGKPSQALLTKLRNSDKDRMNRIVARTSQSGSGTSQTRQSAITQPGQSGTTAKLVKPESIEVDPEILAIVSMTVPEACPFPKAWDQLQSTSMPTKYLYGEDVTVERLMGANSCSSVLANLDRENTTDKFAMGKIELCKCVETYRPKIENAYMKIYKPLIAEVANLDAFPVQGITLGMSKTEARNILVADGYKLSEERNQQATETYVKTESNGISKFVILSPASSKKFRTEHVVVNIAYQQKFPDEMYLDIDSVAGKIKQKYGNPDKEQKSGARSDLTYHLRGYGKNTFFGEFNALIQSQKQYQMVQLNASSQALDGRLHALKSKYMAAGRKRIAQKEVNARKTQPSAAVDF